MSTERFAAYSVNSSNITYDDRGEYGACLPAHDYFKECLFQPDQRQLTANQKIEKPGRNKMPVADFFRAFFELQGSDISARITKG